METTPIAPVKAGIELVERQATPQVDATLGLPENYDVTENALFPETPSEQNAVMEAIKFTKSEPLELIIKPEQEINYNALDATAAGLGDGSGGDGNSFVQLTRIHESVNGNSYNYGFNPLGVGDIIQGQAEYITLGETALEPPAEPPVEPPVPPVEPPVEPPVPPVEPPVPPVEPPVPPVEPPVPPVEPPVEPPKPPKDHQDNGGGNGVDNAPGGSGDTKGDDADGSNTPGTKDTLDPRDVLPDEDDIPLPSKGNNGFGNGDQSAPGNSGPNNNAENDLTPNLDHPNLSKLLNMEQHNNIHP